MEKTKEERFVIKRNFGKLRAKRFYDKNKAVLLEKRKVIRRNRKEDAVVEKVIAIEPVFDLELVTSNLDTLCDNEITRKTHQQRIKTFFFITEIDNLHQANESEKIISSMKIATFGKKMKRYRTNSLKNLMESFLFCLDKMNINLGSNSRIKLQDYYNSLKIVSNDELNTSKISNLNSVMNFDTYMEKIKTKFGIESKQFLLISLYNVCTARDDFDLYIVSTQEETGMDTTKNYLVIKDNEYFLCIQAYKTSNKKDKIFIQLESPLVKLIDDYMKLHKIEIGGRLFPTKNGSNSTFITKMSKDIGINRGGISYLRHSKISTELGKMDMDPLARVELAKKCFHNIMTQYSYLRYLQEE